MSDTIVGCHKSKHLLDLLVVSHLSAVKADAKSFSSRLLEDRLIVGEFSFRRIAAQVDPQDDIRKFLTQARKQREILCRFLNSISNIDRRNKLDNDVRVSLFA